MKLYELVGRDRSQGFSPFVWRSKLALAHKGLGVEMVPLGFTQIADTLSFADSKTVPVLEDGENIICDSWDIALYLEDNYKDSPSLFSGETGRASAKLLNFQIAKSLLMPLFRTIVADIYEVLGDQDKDYFRKSREARIGCTLEEAAQSCEGSFAVFKENLWAYSQLLRSEDYFSGAGPAYHDYIVYSTFLWARGTSPKVLLEDDDPLTFWLQRMDQLYDGLGGTIKSIA